MHLRVSLCMSQLVSFPCFPLLVHEEAAACWVDKAEQRLSGKLALGCEQQIAFVLSLFALAKESASWGREGGPSAQCIPRVCDKSPVGEVDFPQVFCTCQPSLFRRNVPFTAFSVSCFLLKWKQQQLLALGRGGWGGNRGGGGPSAQGLLQPCSEADPSSSVSFWD